MSKKRSAETGRILSRDGKDPLLLGFGCKRVRGFDGFNFPQLLLKQKMVAWYFCDT